MTDERAIARKINDYTVEDVKALSLLLITQNERDEALRLNDFANNTAASVLVTVASHTSNDNDCLACVLKVAWSLVMNAFMSLEEVEEGAGEHLVTKAREMIRQMAEQMETSRRD